MKLTRRIFSFNSIVVLLVSLVFFTTIAPVTANKIKPVYTYLSDIPTLSTEEKVTGKARILTLKNRKGINPTSIHTVIELKQHTLNEPQGTVVLWFFSLEDLAASFMTDNMKLNNPHYAFYPFLSDNSRPNNVDDANFHFGWDRGNELRAQFHKGVHFPAYEPPFKAFVQAVPFNYFNKHQWYQVAFTWDDKAKNMDLYVNGIRVGKSDRFNQDFYREKVNPTLYTGAPALCHGEIRFYNQTLSEKEIYSDYKASATDYNVETEKQLRHVFGGENLRDFTFKPDANWTKKMDISFKNPEDINNFYIQGHVSSIKPNGHPDGLLIETPNVTFERKNRDQQVYIWSNQTFEGNIYVEFEWMALKPNGLSLLMVYASGMAREPFMEDYPKRTSGQMWTIYKEDVRSYHWEFYREMNDVRNDVASSFSRKNPYAFRNGFGCDNKPVEINKWYKTQFLVIDGKAQGAIDGKVMLEFTDNSRTNTGCILNYGNIAIRAMLRSKLVYRNLKVFTEKLPFTEEILKNE